MRVSCLIDSVSRKSGGLFESVRRLASSLPPSRAEVSVVGLEDEFSSEDIGEWRPLRVQVLPVQGPAFFGYSWGLSTALVRSGADILLTHGIWQYSSRAANAWHRRTGRPYVVHPHGMLDPWAVNNSRWKKRLAGWLYENRNLRGSAAIRALCDSEVRSVRQFGLKNPVCVIPNGIDPPLSVGQEPPPWRPSSKYTLLYLGRLHPKKNLGPLLVAWKRAVGSNGNGKDWKLIIAGWEQGGYGDQMQALARKLELEASVEFLGSLYGSSKAAAYRHCDGFVLPSLSEGLPMVILEAWSYGKPVLMTPQCNLPEGFAREAALRIETTSTEIETGLHRLFEMSDGDRKSMGERGRQLTLEKFSWPQIGEEMYRVCQWVLGGGSPPSSVRFD